MFKGKDKNGKSCFQKVFGKNSIDKISLARKVTDNMEITDFEGRFDWEDKMKELVSTIKQWNE